MLFKFFFFFFFLKTKAEVRSSVSRLRLMSVDMKISLGQTWKTKQHHC